MAYLLAMKRDWAFARDKVESEGHCRVCGSPHRPEAAHVVGRRVDQRRGRVLYVNPDSIVPLCGPPTDTSSCHGRFDAHELDLLPHLTLDEQIQAVRDAGGVEQMRIRTAPSCYRSAA